MNADPDAVWKSVYMAMRYHARRREGIQLLGGACTTCGATEKLEIVRTTGTGPPIHTIWGVARADYLALLADCALYCGTCRRRRDTAHRAVPHGGGKSGRRNCPCPPCKQRKREYMQEYAKRHKPQENT